MRRSALVVLVTVLVGMFLPALPAAAAGSTVVSPKVNQVVTGTIPVEVSVARAVGESVRTVRARLSRSGSDSHSSAELTCKVGCDQSSASQSWGGSFNPRTPFGGSGPIRNGTWYIQSSVNGGDFGSGAKIYISLPPSQVTHLAVSSEQRNVRLTWKPAPEPDTGYRVERRTTGAWQAVGKELQPGTGSYAETVPSDGKYEYQVISVRPKGTPEGGKYTAEPSRPASTTVSAPTRDPTPHKDPPTKPESGAQDGNAARGSAVGQDAAAGSTGRGSGPAPSAAGGSDAGARVNRGPLAGSVPPPPPARRGFSFSLRSLGHVFGFQPQDEVEGGEEGYFGEGEGFSEELDYSGIDPVTGEPIAVPLRDTGFQGVLISQLINRPLLMSLAIGLLFVLLAVFILRWIRRSPVPKTGPGNSPTASETPLTWLRRFLRATGEPVASKRVPSPTATPLSPRAPTQTRPVRRTVRGPNAAVTANGPPTGTSPPERRPTRQSATAPIFAGEAETRPPSRGEARSGSDLFPQPGSPASPPSARDQSGSDTGTETVRVLRPEPSPRGTGRRVR
ncbi:MAG: hypothetical protein M3O70_05395 [Actinomycetota bacterium]|nr:hypothetical protein [Actinomycetota bacterium]